MTSRESVPEPAAHPWRIVFQPLVDLRTWRVIGVEALARFADGRSPLDHLSEAEHRGALQALELQLISAAVAEVAVLPPELLVTLNASGATMLNPELPTALEGLERTWGLEMFEAPSDANFADIRTRLTSLGGQLLVDDACAAAGDAERISALRPDVVKIDRAQFWELAADANSLTRLTPVLNATREVGALLLVEGVSEPEHLETARMLGAELGQGFHLGMPTPAADFSAMLAELRRSIGVDAPGL